MRVANCVHTADATQLDSCVASASAVCIGLHMIQAGQVETAYVAYGNPVYSLSIYLQRQDYSDNENPQKTTDQDEIKNI